MPRPSDADRRFLGDHPSFSRPDFDCGLPRAQPGMFLAGPAVVSYSEAMSGSGLFSLRTLPQFIVAGYYLFDRPLIQQLTAEPTRCIQVVVTGPLGSKRMSIDAWIDDYEYEAVGIDESPAEGPPWKRPDGVSATGGPFNLPMALCAPEPADGPYTLSVQVVFGDLSSNEVRIQVVP